MANFYSEQDLCDIIDANVKDYEVELGKPDKIINSFLKIETISDCVSIVCQCRIYLNSKKLIFFTDDEIYVLPFNKIIGYTAIDKAKGTNPIMSATTTTTTTDTGNVIKRAIIGGAVGGSVGAIIGGSTAKKTTKVDTAQDYANVLSASLKSISNYVLNINIDDILFPLISLPFHNDKEVLEQVTSTLNVIIKRNADSTQDEETKVIKGKSNIVGIGIDLDKTKYDPYRNLRRTTSNVANSKKSSSIFSSKAILCCIAIVILGIIFHSYLSREIVIGIIVVIIAIMYYFYKGGKK